MRVPITVSLCVIALALASSLHAAAWQWQNPLPDGNAIGGVAFADPLTGWAVGGYGTILKTTDGGVTWGEQNPGTNADFATVACTGPNRV
jgi:photosystem II stability/assembly factor-like uncharacterized protein